MNQFTISDIENLCGIKAHTLRVWEQRYNLCVARRKESLHRVYDNEDLKELLRIAYLYHHGHKISKIAGLSKEEIDNLVQNSSSDNDNYGIYIHQLLEAALDFDKIKFEKAINCFVVRMGLEKCIIEIFNPLLQRMGILWMTNNLIPAQEHFTSHIIRKKIILATDGLEGEINPKSNTLLFCPSGEFHEIPLLVANYFLRKNGHQTTYLGTNVSFECIRYFVSLHKVDRIYMHIIASLDNCGIGVLVKDLHDSFPGKQLLISGPAVKCISPVPDYVKVFHTIPELVEFSKGNH